MSSLSEVTCMLRTNIHCSPYAVLACAALLAACENSTNVGSACVDGVCPEALTNQADACLLTVQEATFELELLANEIFSLVCLGSELQRNQEGLAGVRVYYVINVGAEPFVACTDRAFLKPVHDALSDQLRNDYPHAEVCELNQLAIVRTDAEEPVVAEGDGFYYDDFSEDLETDCYDFQSRLAFTANAAAWPGVFVHVVASQLRDQDGEYDSELACEPRAGSDPVGTPCVPADRSVYSDGEAIIETRSESCGDGLCMAYHLDGDIDPSCEPSESRVCVPEEDVAARLYCTCRCGGPPGTPNLCDCPTGFSCVNVVSDPGSDFAGSYCVADGDGTPPEDPPPTDEAMRLP
jgi:hypothetical protein